MLYLIQDLCGLTAEDSVLQQYPILKTPPKAGFVARADQVHRQIQGQLFLFEI